MLEVLQETYLFEAANYVIADTVVEQLQSTNLCVTSGYSSSLHLYNDGFDWKDPRISVNNEQIICVQILPVIF
jgi:hypothetical protein